MAEKIYRVLEKNHERRCESGLDKVFKMKGQIREIIDLPDQVSARGRGGSELSRRKRRRVDDERDDEGGEGEETKLSTVIEHDIGPDWHSRVMERAKELVQSRLF